MAVAGTTITGIQAMAFSYSTISVAVTRCATTTAAIGASVATIGTARTEAVMMVGTDMVGARVTPVAMAKMRLDGRKPVVARFVIATVTARVPMATAGETEIAAGKEAKAMTLTLCRNRTPMPQAGAVTVVVSAAGVTDAMDIVSPYRLRAMPISLLRRS